MSTFPLTKKNRFYNRRTKATPRKNKTLKQKKENDQMDGEAKTFTENDYNSKDGMLTTIWGPGVWHFLHTMSFNYPVNPSADDKIHYRNFVLSLKHVLPCGKCRENFKKNLLKMPITMKEMKSRHTFSMYIYKLHDLVNKMLGKNSGLTYEVVKERYENFRARCSPNKKTIKKENGCINPIYGEKSKCVLHIVPQTKKCDTLIIDPNSSFHRSKA